MVHKRRTFYLPTVTNKHMRSTRTCEAKRHLHRSLRGPEVMYDDLGKNAITFNVIFLYDIKEQTWQP
jgi:hypothetical protein